MKKPILFIIIVLFFSVHAFSQGNLKFLKIEVPTEGKTKNRLLFDLEDIKKMLGGLKLEELSANINFTDLGGYSLATLGKIKKGKIDWSHKIVDEKSLLVKFKKDDYSMVLDKVKEKSRNPGFQIQIVEVKFDILSTKRKLDRYVAEKAKFKEAEGALSIYEITFAEFISSYY